ncbi:MAG: aldolase/citrate lyase family protein [Kiritimatiellae bacterium]|nr:aldolase/citrate lyase family protein [Kiritimatiellia bacterium]MDD5520776.1 aldolase/citrate lyase family protein [Kiritimatiellia bacterium]
MINRHMADGSLRRRLLAGEMVYGLFIVELRAPGMGVLIDTAGYDFAIFDMEHGSYTMSELAAMLPGFSGCHCVPLVRVPTVRREFFQPLLDLGVSGIVVPMVESAVDARMCVDLMKYPPAGKRGVAYCRPHSFFKNPTGGHFPEEANENTLLVLQIETAKGVEHLDEILAVPGIDVIFVGDADLAQSLGCSDNMERGQVRDVAERILRTANSRKIIGGVNVVDPEIIAKLHEIGARFVTLTGDVDLFIAGLEKVIKNQRTWSKGTVH